MEGSVKKYYIAILQMFISDDGDIREMDTEEISIELRKYITKENLDKGSFIKIIKNVLRVLREKKCILSWVSLDFPNGKHSITSDGYNLLSILSKNVFG